MWQVPLRDNPGLLLYVIDRMREADRREIAATRFDISNVELMDFVIAIGGEAWIAGRGDEPIAACGLVEARPGCWSMWLFATDNFPQIGLSMTKCLRRVIVPWLIRAGAHRMETLSMGARAEAHRWLEALGAEREATLREYGRGREDFISFAWRLG